jgi:hypothetical protein
MTTISFLQGKYTLAAIYASIALFFADYTSGKVGELRGSLAGRLFCGLWIISCLWMFVSSVIELRRLPRSDNSIS